MRKMGTSGLARGSAPQAGQVSLSVRPQPPQNQNPAGFSNAQVGHRMVRTVYGVAVWMLILT